MVLDCALRRSEIHYFQHLDKASPDYCAQVAINTRKKQKFKIHTESFFKIMLIMVHFRDKVERKKFFKVCLVGTPYLCLREPEKMQKTRNQSDHPRQRKRPKTGKNRPNSNLAIYWQVLSVFSA